MFRLSGKLILLLALLLPLQSCTDSTKSSLIDAEHRCLRGKLLQPLWPQLAKKEFDFAALMLMKGLNKAF